MYSTSLLIRQISKVRLLLVNSSTSPPLLVCVMRADGGQSLGSNVMEIRKGKHGFYEVHFNMGERELIAKASDNDNISRFDVVKWLIQTGVIVLSIAIKRK